MTKEVKKEELEGAEEVKEERPIVNAKMAGAIHDLLQTCQLTGGMMPAFVDIVNTMNAIIAYEQGEATKNYDQKVIDQYLADQAEKEAEVEDEEDPTEGMSDEAKKALKELERTQEEEKANDKASQNGNRSQRRAGGKGSGKGKGK